MKLVALFLLLCSHLPVFWPCVRAIRNRRLPRSIDLIGLSFLVYFDLEIAFEAFGGRYANEFYRPFFSSEHLGLSIALLMAAPWIIKFGYTVASDLLCDQAINSIPQLTRPRLFYFSALAICLSMSAASLFVFTSAPAIWSARSFVGGLLGPYIIFLYLPMGILAFYVRQPESRTKWGKVFTALLLLLSIATTIPIGERTLMLVPVLIVALFGGKPSLPKLGIVAAALLLAAIFMLQFTKSQFSEDASSSDMASSVFSGDLARGPVLSVALKNSLPIGSRLMPYPGAGYVYGALFYIPRPMAPFKGDSTATVFTAKMTAGRPSETHWNLVFGAIEEVCMNFGWFAVPFGLLLYGATFALLDSVANHVPVFKVLSLLAAFWSVGYDISAILNTFGAIAIFGGLCHLCFNFKDVP